MTTILANFGYPLSLKDKERLLELLGLEDDTNLKIYEREARFKASQPFVRQAKLFIDKLELAVDEWKEADIIVMPPGHPSAAVAIVEEIRYRMGEDTPSCVRLVNVSRYGEPKRFEVAEIMRFE